MRQAGGGHEDGQDRREAGANSRWEWVAAAFGLLLVLASIGYLAWLQFAGGHEKVDPVVRVTSVERQEGRHLVRLRVTNAGRGAAAALRVTGRLSRDGRVVEEKATEFQHLPGRSSREAGLFFREDPKQFELTLSADSYQKP